MAEVPVFDSLSYQRVCSRIGRLKKSLHNKVKGSRKCTDIEDTLQRAEKLKKRIILNYLSELAVYCVESDVETTLDGMKRNKAIPDDQLVIKVVSDNWVRFRVKVYKLKTAGETT